jgi:choline dehydrogenase-like flavoprotein
MSHDIIIIGTGAGGATVARELSKNNQKILLLEKGDYFGPGEAARNIKITSALKTSEESSLGELLSDDPSKEISEDINFHQHNLELMYVEGVGGTTPVSLANACYACSTCYSHSTTTQFQGHDLELFKEFLDASKEIGVNPLPHNYRGPTTNKMVEAAENLGYFMEAMPKFIDFSICDQCGNCLYHCKTGAKWDSNQFVKDAQEAGSQIITNFEVKKILHDSNEVSGVEGILNGEKKVIKSKTVILAAGALNTPIILRNSGITEGVGEGLFCDLFITVGAYLKDAKLTKEIPMAVKCEFGPYFISPHYSGILPDLIQEKYQKNGKSVEKISPNDVVGLMVKIADESNGYLDEEGNVHKEITSQDLKLLNDGIEKAKEIFIEMGADPDSIVCSPVRGAHPGGTAAMGKVVDNSMQTSLKGLYVADASVIPRAPGRPPILTIVAMAKKMVKILNKNEFKESDNSKNAHECI